MNCEDGPIGFQRWYKVIIPEREERTEVEMGFPHDLMVWEALKRADTFRNQCPPPPSGSR